NESRSDNLVPQGLVPRRCSDYPRMGPCGLGMGSRDVPHVGRLTDWLVVYGSALGRYRLVLQLNLLLDNVPRTFDKHSTGRDRNASRTSWQSSKIPPIHGGTAVAYKLRLQAQTRTGTPAGV